MIFGFVSDTKAVALCYDLIEIFEIYIQNFHCVHSYSLLQCMTIHDSEYIQCYLLLVHYFVFVLSMLNAWDMSTIKLFVPNRFEVSLENTTRQRKQPEKNKQYIHVFGL